MNKTNKRYIVKFKDFEFGFDAEPEAEKFADEKRQWLVEKVVDAALSDALDLPCDGLSFSTREDKDVVRVTFCELLTAEQLAAVKDDIDYAFLSVESVEEKADRTILTIREKGRFSGQVWIDDQYESFARLLEQANRLPDCNESTFWRALIAEALEYCEYIPLSDVQQLQMSVADKEDFENGIPDGSMWVHIEAWTKLREVNFEFVVSRVAERTGYRLADHSRDGEFYSFLIIPGKAEI